MPTFSSRAGMDDLAKKLSTHEYKAKHNNSNYERPELSEKFVYEYAHLMTMEQMATMFMVALDTIKREYGEAYKAGQAHNVARRKKDLETLLNQLRPDDTPSEIWGEEGYTHRHKDAKTAEFIKATELWARWFDKLGKPEVVQAPSNPLASLSAEELEATLKSLGYAKIEKKDE
jgi:hypothetical protein